MAQSSPSLCAAQKLAATNTRNLRTFLLMEQFAAREIGARIAQARKERGMTQEEFAELTSFSKRSLQDYENGVTIPYRHLREISRLLSRPEEWFLYGDPDEGTTSIQSDITALRSEVAEVRELLRQLLGRNPGSSQAS